MENGRSIGEAKGHNEMFKLAKRNVKGGFPLVTFTDVDKMVVVSQALLGENLGSIDYFKKQN